jgi:hypothetical protein
MYSTFERSLGCSVEQLTTVRSGLHITSVPVGEDTTLEALSDDGAVFFPAEYRRLRGSRPAGIDPGPGSPHSKAFRATNAVAAPADSPTSGRGHGWSLSPGWDSRPPCHPTPLDRLTRPYRVALVNDAGSVSGAGDGVLGQEGRRRLQVVGPEQHRVLDPHLLAVQREEHRDEVRGRGMVRECGQISGVCLQ